MKNKITCPICSGIGFIFGLLKPVSIQCLTCEGKGLISDKKLLWIIQGAELKQFRLKKLKLTLRETCRQYDIDPSYLSKIENGIIKPKNIYL